MAETDCIEQGIQKLKCPVIGHLLKLTACRSCFPSRQYWIIMIISMVFHYTPCWFWSSELVLRVQIIFFLMVLLLTENLAWPGVPEELLSEADGSVVTYCWRSGYMNDESERWYSGYGRFSIFSPPYRDPCVPTQRSPQNDQCFPRLASAPSTYS